MTNKEDSFHGVTANHDILRTSHPYECTKFCVFLGDCCCIMYLGTSATVFRLPQPFLTTGRKDGASSLLAAKLFL